MIVGFAGTLLFACGDKKKGEDTGGDKAGDAALLAEAKDVAKQYCECPDSQCRNAVKSATGKNPTQIFFKEDTSKMTKEEMAGWQEARSQWNECGKPGYKPPAAAGDAPTDEAAGDAPADDAAAGDAPADEAAAGDAPAE